jgi:hypothetical protein
VDWLLEHLQSCAQGFRTVGSHVSVDEAMIQNTGRSAHKYFMRHKPIPEGYKFFVLAEGGYVFNFYPETPVPKARLPLEPRPFQRQYTFSRTSEIVIHLLRSLPFSQHYFEVAMDNYFTNPLLFQFLRDELNMGAYGTLRGTFGTKSEPCPLDTVSASTPLPYHFLTGSVLRRNVLGALWMDNAPVKMLTTKHKVADDGATVPAARCLPSERRCSAPKESVNAVFADPMENGSTVYEKTVPIPAVVEDYNKYMGGVDRANQLRAVYTSHQPTGRNWLSLLWFVMDTAVDDSYIIFKVAVSPPPAPHWQVYG